MEDKDGGKPWFWVHLFCRCMITSPDETNRHGEVNWRQDEIVLLEDDAAMKLMESHVCRKPGD